MSILSSRCCRQPSGRLGAGLSVIGVASGLAVSVVLLLPTPSEVFAPVRGAGLSAQIDRIAVSAVTILCWGLTVWSAAVALVVVGAAVAAGHPRGERILNRCVRMLLPRALRGLAVTAIGVGSLTALSGCAPGSVTAAAATDTVTGSASGFTIDGVGTPYDGSGPPGPGTAPVPLTMVLDWPLEPAATPTTVAGSAAQPAPPAAAAAACYGCPACCELPHLQPAPQHPQHHPSRPRRPRPPDRSHRLHRPHRLHRLHRSRPR